MTKTGLDPKWHGCLPKFKATAVKYGFISWWQLPICESQYVLFRTDHTWLIQDWLSRNDSQTLGIVHSAFSGTDF